MQKNYKVRISQFLLHLIIAGLLFIMLYPLAMAFWNSFKSDFSYSQSRWYPTLPLRIKNIAVAFGMVKGFIINTVIVAAAGPAAMLGISSLSAYTFSRMEFPFRKALFSMVMLLMMVPGVLTLVPAYILYKGLGFYDSLFALILPIATGGCIFGVFLLNSFFGGLPKDIFESAKIDGAKEFECYYKIALPLCIPIMGTLAIIQIIGVWNDFLWPRIMLSEEKYTISAGLLLTFAGEFTSNMPVMFAGYLVASSPLILLFIFANKFYIEGLVSTSIKM